MQAWLIHLRKGMLEEKMMIKMSKPTGQKSGTQFEFRKKAAAAFLETATNPNARFEDLTGSLPHLREMLGKRVDQLAHVGSAKPWGKSPTLSIAGDKWSMTKFGAQRYEWYLENAREQR
jgi:hypothetical protein